MTTQEFTAGRGQQKEGSFFNPRLLGIPAISQKTVRNQVSNILSKLQVVDRAQAIIRAREAGLGL